MGPGWVYSVLVRVISPTGQTAGVALTLLDDDGFTPVSEPLQIPPSAWMVRGAPGTSFLPYSFFRCEAGQACLCPGLLAAPLPWAPHAHATTGDRAPHRLPTVLPSLQAVNDTVGWSVAEHLFEPLYKPNSDGLYVAKVVLSAPCRGDATSLVDFFCMWVCVRACVCACACVRVCVCAGGALRHRSTTCAAGATMWSGTWSEAHTTLFLPFCPRTWPAPPQQGH